ncbi:sensory rhodopsin transducer [Halorientalis halophila]|uniref:sensory rhodopsin transducer n=1 Tax=Halorientalis halophila TaxID=3108499 RepID=UPI00300A569B
MIGRTRWAIPEGYIPETSTGPEPEMESHETICLLNAGDADAHVQVTVYFEDRDPAGPYELSVPAERTRHVQFNDFEDPEIPRGTAFASVIESDRRVVCQHTRLDSRQAENALLSTVAFPGDS